MIQDVILTIIGLYWMAFSAVVHTSDKWSMLLGKVVPFLTGLYIVHYVLIKYQKSKIGG